jgi:transposase
MDTIGLDLHKRESQLCVLTADGELIERRIATTRERFTAVLGARPRARILLEASAESEWMARHLAALGHEVIVADPGFAPMDATRSRRVKTDERDARALCEACRLGAYRATHRVADAQRHVRAELAVRDALVRTRTRYAAIIKAAARRAGCRLAQGEPERTAAKLAAAPLAEGTARELAPLVAPLGPVNAAIADADRRLAVLARESAPARLLQTVPMTGPVTARGFVAALDDVGRFEGPHQVAAYLGLVPSERRSGEQQHRGRITKRGDSRTRWLLVEAARRIRRSKDPALAPLNAWADRIAVRRGRRVAIVAPARRLTGILFAMWRSGTPSAAARVRADLPSPVAA